MPETARDLSPEEMGLPKEEEQKPKLTIIEGGKKESMIQGYSEQDAKNLEEGITSLVEQGLIDKSLAQRQIEDIRSRITKIVEPGEQRDRYVAAGEIGVEEPEKAVEKSEILEGFERKINYSDIPGMFEVLDDTKEMGLMDDTELKRQKMELLTNLQKQSGWRLLENENLQNLLAEEKFSKKELQAVMDNIKETYNPSSERWYGGKNYEEIDKAVDSKIISKEQANSEKLNLIAGVESSVGVDLSGARELLKMDKLSAEEFEAMTADAVGKVAGEKKIAAERKRLEIEPVLLSDVERDEMFTVIDETLDNINAMSRKKLTKEERQIMEQKKADYKGLKKEIELNYNIVDTKDIPGLVRNGELSPERARDMLGDNIERTQKNAKAIEDAARFRELKLEDEAIVRGYDVVDQLNAAGKLDFNALDIMGIKSNILNIGSKLYRDRKNRESKGIFGRMGNYFRTRFTEKGKKEIETQTADKQKFAELLQQRADMESKFWSVARMSAEDQDTLVKYNIFERKQTEEEAEKSELQVFPQQVEAAMNDIMSGKIDIDSGLENIRNYRKMAEKRAEEFAMQEFDAEQVKNASELIQELFDKNVLSFNKANFLESLAQTRSEFAPPAEKVKAREKLLAMELEVYQSINNVSLSELGEALRAFRE